MKISKTVIKLFRNLGEANSLPNDTDPEAETVELHDPVLVSKVSSGEIMSDVIAFTLKQNKNTLKYVFVDQRLLDLHWQTERSQIQQERAVSPFMAIACDSISTLYNIELTEEEREGLLRKNVESISKLLEAISQKVAVGKPGQPSGEGSRWHEESVCHSAESVCGNSASRNVERKSAQDTGKGVAASHTARSPVALSLLTSLSAQTLKISKAAVR